MSVFSPSVRMERWGKKEHFSFASILIVSPPRLLPTATMAYLCRQGEHRGAVSWNDNLSWMNSHMSICLRLRDNLVLNKSENISHSLDPWRANVQYVHTWAACQHEGYAPTQTVIPHKCVDCSLTWDANTRKPVMSVIVTWADRTGGTLTFVKRQLHFLHRVTEARHSVETLGPEPCRNKRASFQTLRNAARTWKPPSLRLI